MAKRGRQSKNRRPVHITESFQQMKAAEALVSCGYPFETYSGLIEKLVIEKAREVVKQSGPEAMQKYSIVFSEIEDY